MCSDDEEKTLIPTDNRAEISALIVRLHNTQRAATERVQAATDFEALGHSTPDGFTVNDALRMWVWHFWSHHRDLVRARGPFTDTDPHFQAPHYAQQAHRLPDRVGNHQ